MGKEWTAVIKKVNPEFIHTAYSVICNKHFDDTDYTIRGKLGNTFLKKTAVPSIFNTSKLYTYILLCM